MRFLRLKVREDRLADLQRFYRERVVSALKGTAGCVFASLLEPASLGGDFVSLTLWRSAEDAEAYEQSGLFRTLLDECAPFLAGASEWKVRLADAETGVGHGAVVPAEVAAFKVSAGKGKPELDTVRPTRMNLRIVSLLVREGQVAELAHRYRTEIAPAVLQAQGCIGSFLVEGVDKPNRALSITLWARDEDAVRYEMSGAFEEFARSLQDILVNLSQWKMALTGPDTELSSGPVDGDRYSVVVGERFGGDGSS